jgi:TM2 domain/GYF domain 2
MAIQTGTFLVQRMGGEDGPYALTDLSLQVRAGQLKATSLVRKAEGGTWFQASEIPGLFSDKDWLAAILLSLFVGWFGIDRFYLGYMGLGILKLITFGFCGIWYIIDIILLATGRLDDANGLPLRRS